MYREVFVERKKNSDIQFFHRKNNRIETETVYGGGFVKLIYENKMGKFLSPFFATKTLSQIYGFFQDVHTSKSKVPPFVKKFGIDLSEYKPGSRKADKKENTFKNFNEFFIREFMDGKRKFIENPSQMGAFAEARYVGFDSVTPEDSFPVKGVYLNEKELLGGHKDSYIFEGGPLMIARLCPVDYHRYHYPDNGKTIESFHIRGEYHSVNPIALKARPKIFMANERRVSILETENFGKLAFIEVGAVCVGKIVQSFDESKDFKKGDEKGYFLFGGSTVAVIGEKGRWAPSKDIVENTKKGIETYIQLGDEVGVLL